MKTMPYFIFRGTLLMVFLMIIACLALTRGTITASSGTEQNSVLPESQASLPEADEQAENNACELSTYFPQSILQWCDLITRYARHHDLPPDLIGALIWQESGGKSFRLFIQRRGRFDAGDAARRVSGKLYLRKRSLFCQPPGNQ